MRRSCYTDGDGDLTGSGEEMLLRGLLVAAKCRSRVNNPLRFRTKGDLWSHQRFDKRARKFIGPEKERRRRMVVGKVVALFR